MTSCTSSSSCPRRSSLPGTPPRGASASRTSPRGSPPLHAGSCRLTEAPAGVLAYQRAAGTEKRIVLVNFTGERVPVAAHGRVEIASDGAGEDRPYAGVLAPAQALVLRP